MIAVFFYLERGGLKLFHFLVEYPKGGGDTYVCFPLLNTPSYHLCHLIVYSFASWTVAMTYKKNQAKNNPGQAMSLHFDCRKALSMISVKINTKPNNFSSTNSLHIDLHHWQKFNFCQLYCRVLHAAWPILGKKNAGELFSRKAATWCTKWPWKILPRLKM